MFKLNKPVLQEQICDIAYSGYSSNIKNKDAYDSFNKEKNIEKKCFSYFDQKFKCRDYEYWKHIDKVSFKIDEVFGFISYFKKTNFTKMNLIEKFIILLFSFKNNKYVNDFYSEFNIIKIIEDILENELMILNYKYNDGYDYCSEEVNNILLLKNKYLACFNLLEAIELTKKKYKNYEFENEIFIINHFIKNNDNIYFDNTPYNFDIYMKMNNYLLETNLYTEDISNYIFKNFSKPIYLNKF